MYRADASAARVSFQTAGLKVRILDWVIFWRVLRNKPGETSGRSRMVCQNN